MNKRVNVIDPDTARVLLYNRIRQVVRGLVRGELAEDVTQDVWIKVQAKGLNTSVPYVTLKHMTYDAMRVYARREMGSTEGRDETAVTPPGCTQSNIREMITLAGLTPSETRAILGRYWLDKTEQELAVELRLSPLDMKLMCRSALRKIEETIGREITERET